MRLEHFVLVLCLCGCAYGNTQKARLLDDLLNGINFILSPANGGVFHPAALTAGFRNVVILMQYSDDQSVEPQVTDNEFKTYVGKDMTTQTITNLNLFLKDLADDSETIPTVEGNAQQYNALRINGFALMAQLYIRAYNGLFTPLELPGAYQDFVSTTVSGVYYNGAAQPTTEEEWDEVLADDGDALLAFVPNDDINVHIWHLASALRKIAYTEDYQNEKRSLLVVDGAMLLGNIVISMDYVLRGSRSTFSDDNYVYRYGHDGAFYLLNNFANERRSSVQSINEVKDYVAKMLNGQFYPGVQDPAIGDPNTRWSELSVTYLAKDATKAV